MRASLPASRSRSRIGDIRPTARSGGWGAPCMRLTKRAGLRPKDIDGFAVSSFTVAPDTAVGLTQHFGLSPRGSITSRSAARAPSWRCVVRRGRCRPAMRTSWPASPATPIMSLVSQDAFVVFPLCPGRGLSVRVRRRQCVVCADHQELHEHLRRQARGLRKICIAQRDNALSIPHAMMKKKLTLDEYMSARPIADPIHLFDCVMPCAGAEAFLVCREDTAKSLGLPSVRILSTIERHNAFPDDPMQVRGGWALDAGELWSMAALAPERCRFRRDLRRLSGHIDDAVRGPRLLPPRARDRISSGRTR